jgi:ABC-type branched-subunit amino acid transport system substrate-binding protein
MPEIMEHLCGERQVMFNRHMDRRKLVTLAALALLGGCKVIPTGPVSPAPAPSGPSSDVLPDDSQRHRIALLVPLSGPNASVGQSIANAATMALLDTNAQNLRVTNYDTAGNVGDAASKAIADGNKLILGPLLSEHIPAVSAAARHADVPVISFSNDETAATRDVFIMGNLPSQSVARTVKYAHSQGIKSFAALVPQGEYGKRASSSLLATARAEGATVVTMETYDRSNASATAAARRLHEKGGFQAVLIADGGRIAALTAPLLKADGDVRLLGTELWSGENVVIRAPALRGAWFASVADTRFRQFSNSYKSRFGTQPYRIATLGYDSVLLALRVAREWQQGTPFPTRRLTDPSGFLGLDGAFRFGRNGVIERALEVREVRAGSVATVSPAPSSFGD